MTNDDDEVMHESDHDDDHSVLLQYIYSVIGFYSYSSTKLLGSIHIYLSKLLGLLIFIYQIIGFVHIYRILFSSVIRSSSATRLTATKMIHNIDVIIGKK